MVVLSRRTYHTGLVARFQAGLLGKAELDLLPRSTRWDWRRRDLSRVFGFSEDDRFFAPRTLRLYREIDSVPTLRATVAALYRIHRFHVTLLRELRGSRVLLKRRKRRVTQLIQKVTPALGIARACSLFGISRSTARRWQDEVNCPSSLFLLCRRVYPGQLTVTEQQTVRKYLLDPHLALWPLISRYLRMIRDGAAFMHPGTFYKYARRYGIGAHKHKKSRRRVGVRALTPFEILHIDCTRFITADGTRLWINVIRDNFSRAMLGFRIGPSASSKLAAENLQEVCTRFNLFHRPLTLFCDDGSENAGALEAFLERDDVFFTKVVAQLHTSYSNSMIEALNKIIKYQGLFQANPRTPGAVQQVLEAIMHDFNNRPLAALHGLTPQEVLAGVVPNRDLFASKINHARRARIVVNRRNFCGSC